MSFSSATPQTGPATTDRRRGYGRMWLWLAVSAAAVIATAGSLPATVSAAEPDLAASNPVSAPEIQAYQSAFGVSEKIAVERLELQHRGAGIVGQLKAIQGKRYAGVWFDNQTGTFVVPTLPGTKPDAVKEALDQVSLNGDYHLTPASYSWEELEATHEQLDKSLLPQLHEHVISTSIDPRANAVVVEEAEAAASPVTARVNSLAEVPEVKVDIRPQNVNRFQTTPFTNPCGRIVGKPEGEFPFEFWACDRPARGGAAIFVVPGSSSCSMGFKAVGKEFGHKFVLTAGHCYYGPFGEHNSEWEGRDHTNTSKFLGLIHEAAAEYPSWDYAAIRVDGEKESTYWEGVEWPSEIANFGTSEAWPIEYESSSYNGEVVCHSGMRTGTSCGVVTVVDKTETLEKTDVVYHMTEVQGESLCAWKGDSGGSVWQSHTALGLLSGGGTKGPCGEGEKGEHRMVYTEITEDTDKLAVTVGTRVGDKPAAQTNEANPVEAFKAEGNAKVDPNGLATEYHFDYGPNTSYGSSTFSYSAGSGYYTAEQHAIIPFLTPASTYHYRVVATNSAGTTYGGDREFKTLAEKPVVTTGEAKAVGSTGATFNGTVNPENSESTYWFEYGTTTGYGTETTHEALTGSVAKEVSKVLTTLEFGKTYHYRIVAKNAVGTTPGSDQSFTTGWRPQTNTPPSGAKFDQLAGVSCRTSTECVGVGNYLSSSGVETSLSEIWNGSSWENMLPENPSGSLETLLNGVSCYATNSCIAVGFYQDGGTGHLMPLAEKWNGTKWELMTIPGNGLNRSYLFSVSCTSATSCIADGYYFANTGPETAKTFVERLSGSTWTAEYPPNPVTAGGEPEVEPNYLQSVSCTSSTDCMAVGFHVSSVKSITHFEALVEHWNGTKWEVMTTPTVEGKTDVWLEGVSCTASNACTAVGYAAVGHSDKSIQQSLAMRWNGTEWKVQPTPNTEGTEVRTYLYEVSCTSSTFCLAIGKGGVAVKWNGSTWEWQQLPKAPGGRDLITEAVSCSSSTACMAVGNFENGSNYRGTLSESFVKVLPGTVITKPATGVTESEATLKGTVNPNGASATYWFEYGTTTGYGTKTTETSAGSGSTPLEESKAISSLEAGVKYHFRIVASNSESTAYGKDEVFETGSVKGTLTAMTVTDPFNETTSAISNFGTNWSALGWAGGTTPKGLDRTTGWGPSDAYSTVNGAYYQPAVTDVGTGIADQATMTTNPGNVSRYFSLWLDMGTPGSTRSGYELRFTDTATNVYTVTLSKWVSGTQTVLGTKESYSFVNGNSFALVDKGSTVSAWTNTGSGFGQILSASDSAFSGGNSGVEGSGNFTRLTNFKVGWLLNSVANTDAALKALPLTDAFATNESPLSEGGLWVASAWDNSSSGHNTGQDTTSGWGPYDAYPTINGAFWQKAFSDTGSGDAVSAVLGTSPGAEGNYFSLWLNASNPPVNHNGLELRFTKTGSNYEVALLKWTAGMKTVLASKTGYSFATGSKFALVDKAGTVSAWTNTGTEYTQILSGSDSMYTGGYPGVEGSGSNTRLKEFRSGPMAPF